MHADPAAVVAGFSGTDIVFLIANPSSCSWAKNLWIRGGSVSSLSRVVRRDVILTSRQLRRSAMMYQYQRSLRDGDGSHNFFLRVKPSFPTSVRMTDG